MEEQIGRLIRAHNICLGSFYTLNKLGNAVFVKSVYKYSCMITVSSIHGNEYQNRYSNIRIDYSNYSNYSHKNSSEFAGYLAYIDISTCTSRMMSNLWHFSMLIFSCVYSQFNTWLYADFHMCLQSVPDMAIY